MGLWNLGDTPPVEPNTKGFEEFAGFLRSKPRARLFHRESLSTGDEYRPNRLETISQNWTNAQGTYMPDLLGQMGASFLQTHAPYSFNHYNPLFLCVAYPVPHNTTPPKTSPYSGESWPQAAKDRAAMVSHFDKNIGLLMEALGVWKMETNTIVIFTSIGGPMQEGAMDPKFFGSAGGLRGGAGSVYEGGIRVPMIIRWPAHIKPGQVSDFACAAWDILPTLMETAFLKPPEKTDGISLLPVLTGKEKPSRTKVFIGNRSRVKRKKPRAKAIGKSCKLAPARRSSTISKPTLAKRITSRIRTPISSRT